VNIIKHQINDAYQVIEPNLHDSNLVSVESYEDQATLKFRLVSNELIQAVFSNVNKLVCNNFREGNVVLDVTVERMVKISAHGLNKLFTPPRAMFEKYNAYIRSVNESIESGTMMLVTINPSYGCESIIYCESVCFQKN